MCGCFLIDCVCYVSFYEVGQGYILKGRWGEEGGIDVPSCYIHTLYMDYNEY